MTSTQKSDKLIEDIDCFCCSSTSTISQPNDSQKHNAATVLVKILITDVLWPPCIKLTPGFTCVKHL